jgi:hypothetical protein
VAFTPYATLPEFEAWVGLNDQIDTTVIDDIRITVTRWIDDYTGTHFWQDGTVGVPVARTFAPCNCGCRVLDIDDLVSITTLKTDDAGDGTYETTWSAGDYQLQPVNRPHGEPFNKVEAVGTLTFPMRTVPGSRANRIEITGVWGWAAVPAPVKQACLIQGSRVLKRRYSPEGVSSFGDLGLVRVGSRLDPDVEQLLADYTTTARDTGILIA